MPVDNNLEDCVLWTNVGSKIFFVARHFNGESRVFHYS
jgi:hypothetical protein